MSKDYAVFAAIRDVGIALQPLGSTISSFGYDLQSMGVTGRHDPVLLERCSVRLRSESQFLSDTIDKLAAIIRSADTSMEGTLDA